MGLGSNLGSRRAFLRAALRMIEALPEVRLLARSELYYTPPFGPPQPDYLNAAVAIESALLPLDLLDALLDIEARLGRVRRERFGPRTLDLDLLEGPRQALARLSVPHPRLADRPFALAPLLDVEPWRRPALGGLLEALGGAPPTRSWEGGPPLDRADALAEALSSGTWGTGAPSLGDPVAVVARGRSPEETEARFRAQVEALGPALVTVDHLGEGELRGHVLPAARPAAGPTE